MAVCVTCSPSAARTALALFIRRFKTSLNEAKHRQVKWRQIDGPTCHLILSHGKLLSFIVTGGRRDGLTASALDSGSAGIQAVQTLADGSLCCGARHFTLTVPRGGTPIYGLYRYVPRDRVWF